MFDLFSTIQKDYLLKQGGGSQSGQMQKIKCMLVAPTRELATQIYDDARRLTYQTNLTGKG